MTSGKVLTIPLSSILIDDENRQRKELKEIEPLALSIRNNGLMNFPVVTPDYHLVAGRRRVAACALLGWTSIQVHLTTDLDPVELQLLELEENAKRVDLTWQEHCEAVNRYHTMSKARDPSWTLQKTADGLAVSVPTVSRFLSIQEAAKENPAILAAEKLSTAHNTASRAKERKEQVALRDLAPSTAPSALPPPDRFAALLNTNFFEWGAQAQEPFNFLHCDFPYGISTGDKSGQAATTWFGKYDDGKDIYFALLAFLLENQDNFIAPHAHAMFWLSFRFYQPTKEAFERAGWRVDPYPLIWHKTDNAGIIPDPQRGGRRTYEIALQCTRGDRPIVKPVAISYASPTTQAYHPTEKPTAMLEHFFQMYVDSSSRVLDPTCGSGNSVKAAEKAGAAFSLGIEKSDEFYRGAKLNLKL